MWQSMCMPMIRLANEGENLRLLLYAEVPEETSVLGGCDCFNCYIYFLIFIDEIMINRDTGERDWNSAKH